MDWSFIAFCLLGIALPAGVSSAVGHMCARHRRTRAYPVAMIILCVVTTVAWVYWPGALDAPKHPVPKVQLLIGALSIVTALLAVPATAVYLCVSAGAATRHILPLAVACAFAAFPLWLWLTLIVMHNLMGGS